MDKPQNIFAKSVSDALSGFVSAETIGTTVAVVLILLIGFALVKVLFSAVRRLSRKGLPPRTGMILENLVKYGGFALVLLTATRRAGLDISALLGAAGIAGIALGFAAQTSVANVISGLFLFSEQAFKIGDILQVDSVSGVVESVDLLSIRLRTFDNKLIRVPNETLIKTNIVNVSHFPRRRLDISFTLPHDCDYELVFDIIKGAIASSPFALEDPAPLVMIDSVNQNGTAFFIGAWFDKENFVAIKNQLIPSIMRSLEAKGIKPQANRVAISNEAPDPRGSKELPGA